MSRSSPDSPHRCAVDVLLPTARFVFSVRGQQVDVLAEHRSPEAFEQYVERRAAEPVTGMLTFPNTLLVVGAVSFVIDPGLRLQNEPLLKALACRGLKPSSIDFVALTHAHEDHAAALAELPAVPLVVHEHELRTAHWQAMGHVLEQRELRLLRGDGGELVPGVDWARTAGHTPGGVSYAMQTAGGVVVACGDIIGPGRAPFDEMKPPDVPQGEELLSSWEMIRAWEPALIIAGHLPPFTP